MDIQMPLIQFGEIKSKLVMIPIDQLPPNEELMSPFPQREFIEDIASRGVLVPIQVTKVGPGKFYVIAGRRRIKAVRQLGKLDPGNSKWNTIQALIVDAPDEAAILAASAENNRRSDNVLSDLQALNYLQSKDPNMSIANLAKFSGMSQGTVKSRLKLKKLDPILMQGLCDGRLSPASAEECVKLQDKQGEAVALFLKEGNLSLEDVRDLQRVRVTQTVENENQLVFPDLKPLLPVTVSPDATTVLAHMGFSVLHVPTGQLDGAIDPSVPQTSVQERLESLQAQSDHPEDFVLVEITAI
jgi:ParB/RepB/Spo0J family partition protein